jgi:hypothetical protein
VGVCFSYQGQGDPGLNRKKEEPKIVLKASVQIPTPANDELVFVFDNGDFVKLSVGQTVSLPANETFRAIASEQTRIKFVEKGDTSGNSIWIVERR